MRRFLWWLWTLRRTRCVLCQPRPGTVTLADLCGEHRRRQEEALAEIKRIHPDGTCTGSCGCMSIEEFDRALNLSK